MFRNAKELLARGSGPYFYLPKLESHLEARLWNDVFNYAQDAARHPAWHDPRHGIDRDRSLPRWKWKRFSMNCATIRPA